MTEGQVTGEGAERLTGDGANCAQEASGTHPVSGAHEVSGANPADGEGGEGGTDDAGAGVRVLGIIAEPGLAEKVARKAAGHLPALLERAGCPDGHDSTDGHDSSGGHGSADGSGEAGEAGEADEARGARGARGADGEEGADGAGVPGGGSTWRVEVVRQLLPLDPYGALPLLSVGRMEQRRHGWELAAVLTELPRRAGGRPILGGCAPEQGVVLVSLPAVGAVRVRRRTQDVLLRLLTACRTDRSAHSVCAAPGTRPPGTGSLPSRYRLLDEREARRDTERAFDANVHLEGEGLHLTLPGRWGWVRLLTGMVRANRPWRLVPSLSPALSGAMAGSAFGLFYSSIWQLADASGAGRLTLVSVFAVFAMMAWIILSNGLWERSPAPRLRAFSALYNAATVLTVWCGVTVMFLLLLGAAFGAACIIIPLGYLARTLGHAAGMGDLATVSWLAACLGTVAGALGSGLADEGRCARPRTAAASAAARTGALLRRTAPTPRRPPDRAGRGPRPGPDRPGHGKAPTPSDVRRPAQRLCRPMPDARCPMPDARDASDAAAHRAPRTAHRARRTGCGTPAGVRPGGRGTW